MKKVWSVIYCGVFFALISMPLAFMPWAGYQLTENRPPAPLPELFNDEGLNLALPGEAEDYLMDRFAGRVFMIDAYSRVVGGLFGISANDRVIMGSGGWLFFHETVGDFDGTAALGDAEMDGLIESLLDAKRAAEARGQVFIIAVAPNKNTVYGSFMPPLYGKSGQPTNLDRLLAAEELECVDLGAALLASGHRVYHKTDTHWNGYGARIAALEIMRVIEERTGAIAPFDWDSWSYETGYFVGDLAQMLYPANPPEEENQLFADAVQRFSTVGRFRTLDDLNITTVSDGAGLRVAMYRDSFAEALIPYFSNAYSNVFYTRQTPPPLESSAFLEADVIIIQIAERRIGELIN